MSITSCLDDYDCKNGGSCESPLDFLVDHADAIEPAKCVCLPGYRGHKCEFSCPVLCEHRGKCVKWNDHGELELPDDFRCDCPAGFEGRLCQTREAKPATTPAPIAAPTGTTAPLKPTAIAPIPTHIKQQHDSPANPTLVAGLVVCIGGAVVLLALLLSLFLSQKRNGGESSGHARADELEMEEASPPVATTVNHDEDLVEPSVKIT
ncbi:EGF-like domain [Seminavis robusta]|uniref:EGF-like domain n=1 Tax=Seminavis robusta TaxID=568900 RepID=A0A9N8ECA6_9STRA|nr:EGF-like domain [Seminavis robusta]|eukprot:Sro963_g225280.1 EGF-like domain (207) ;mRNA; f:12381-13001